MRESIALHQRDIPAVFINAARSGLGYSGRTFSAQARETVTLSDNYWSGGTKSSYIGLDIESGEVLPPEHAEYGNPFTHPGVPTVTLAPGKAILEHSRFCGKDCGVRIYTHPDNFRPLLPAPVDLPADELAALNIVAGIKGGQYRREEWSRSSLPGRYGPDNPVLQALKARGYVTINKAGAIAVTIDGRNARRR